MYSFGVMISSGSRSTRPNATGLPAAFDAVVGQAKWAESHGFDAVWVGEGRLATSAVIPMTLIAANTSRVKIGSGILPYRTRNAALLAVTFKTLDDLAPGRMRLGLGPWWEPLATRTGLANRKPLQAMREVITVARELLAGQTVSFSGEFVQVDGIRFDGPADDDGKAYPVPIYIGAVRMGMVALSGEIADGVLLDFLVPPSYNVDAMAAVRRGAERSGRSLDDFEVPQLIACSIDDADPAGAIDDCRAFLTQYIAQQPHITETCGADPELIAAIKAELGWPATKAEVRHTMRLVPDSLVHSVCAAGTAVQALDKIGEWVEAGCTEPVITPLSPDPLTTLDALARKANLLAGAR
jgi:5,10-methylenetetrahydromethanopterin reductase